jgi:ATP-dependent RNA helicase SUPV3L1/SUV3
MWGTNAVGKLVKGAEPASPRSRPSSTKKPAPRWPKRSAAALQHFIDRKVAAQFEPLLAMGRDETLTGLARGFAFRLAEALGVSRAMRSPTEVKELDQDARGACASMACALASSPSSCRAAETRAHPAAAGAVVLVERLHEFPESPPPGLVTIPNVQEVPKGTTRWPGYHPAGTRAIRIDMLERLADILRQKDSRAGFEATPDMLSITGMTLEQFSDLMAGLGYKGEKAERVKVKAAPLVPKAPEISEEAAAEDRRWPADPGGSLDPPPRRRNPKRKPRPEMESFYTFTWAPKPRPRPERHPAPSGRKAMPPVPRVATVRRATARRGIVRRATGPGGSSQGDRPKGDRPQARSAARRAAHAKGGKPKRDERQKSFEARPPRAEKPIDPDNPFAALLALKGKV